MLCQSAFRKKSPPEGFEMLVVQVARHAGSLPLGLNILGSYLRGRDKDYWMDMLLRLENGLDDKIEKILRISYDGLGSAEDQAIFRHIACLFNYMKVTTIKSLLADSNLGVNTGLENLVDKSIIHVRWGHVEMHRLLQEMGRKIVRAQSIDEPGRREFLVDSKDICDVLTRTVGTEKVIGISLDTCGIDELHVHENAFKGMRNLRFLEIDSKKYISEKEVSLHLPESFDYLPPSLKLICWERYPMRSMPSTFCPKHLIKIKMQFSKLEKLWEGAASLTCLKEMDLYGCSYLKKIPNLEMAANLETLILVFCVSLVELSSSVRNPNKLTKLDMRFCESLETLPTFINLKSLNCLDLDGCWRLRNLPEFSTNILKLILNDTSIEQFPCNLRLENLVELQIKNIKREKLREGVQPFTPLLAMLCPTMTDLWLENIPSLVELPCSFQNLNQLKRLTIAKCRNLVTLPTGINLQSLEKLDFRGCSRLRSFPDISTNIEELNLEETGIEEVPWWMEIFSNMAKLYMRGCSRLKCVCLNISKLKHLKYAIFLNCWALTRVELSDYPSEMEMATVPHLEFRGCYNLDPETVLCQQSFIVKSMIFSVEDEEVPSYFTYRTTGVSSLTIPLLHVPLSQPFFRFRVGAVATNFNFAVRFQVNCEFKGRFGNSFDYGSCFNVDYHGYIREGEYMLTILDCHIPLNEDNAPLSQWNFDHVDMHICMEKNNMLDLILSDCSFILKGWGIRLLENRLGNPITLPHVCEANEDNMPIQRLVKSVDSNVETERSRKRMRII